MVVVLESSKMPYERDKHGKNDMVICPRKGSTITLDLAANY